MWSSFLHKTHESVWKNFTWKTGLLACEILEVSSSLLLEAGISKLDVKLKADSLKYRTTSSKVGGTLIERKTLVYSCFGLSGMQSLRDRR